MPMIFWLDFTNSHLAKIKFPNICLTNDLHNVEYVKQNVKSELYYVPNF